MKPITLRNLPPAVARVVRRRARLRRMSLNRTVVEMLQEACRLPPPPETRREPDGIDALAGVWSREEGHAFLEDLARQRRVDPELWR